VSNPRRHRMAAHLTQTKGFALSSFAAIEYILPLRIDPE
jgi:hypothetical protein